MRSKLIRGKMRVGSFYFLFVSAIILTIVLFWMQVAFNVMVDFRLQQLESQISPCEVEIDDSSEDNAKAGQMFDSENKSAYFVNDAEREIVERTVMAEAGGEGIRGMEAVAQVVHNRSVLWNMTPVEVVTQPYQFATYSGEITEECRLAVSNVFDLGVRVFDENVTHFHSGEEPYWTADKESRGMVGGHKFYY